MANPILRRGGSPSQLRRGDNQTLSIGRLDPWNDMSAMDRLFDNFFRSPFYVVDRPNSNGHVEVEPQVELYEFENELIAYLFAAGIDPESLDITATSDQLSVRGERKAQFSPREGITSHTPWASQATGTATFAATYSLPIEIDPNKVTATYKDGVLEIHLAKNDAAKPQQVKVQVSR
jgi:HSP20 family protein